MTEEKNLNLYGVFSEKEFDREFFLNESQRVANIGSYLLDIDTGYWSPSEQLNRIFGIDSSFKRNVESWVNIIHPDHRDMMDDYFKNEVLGKKQNFNKEYKIVRQDDGKVVWVHGLGELIFDRKGNPVRMLGTIQDITEERKIEEELDKCKKELEKMSRNCTCSGSSE